MERSPDHHMSELAAHALAEHWVSDTPGDIRHAASHMSSDSAAEAMAEALEQHEPSRGVRMAASRLCSALQAEAHAMDQPQLQPRAMNSPQSCSAGQPSQSGQHAPSAAGGVVHADQPSGAPPPPFQPLKTQGLQVPALRNSKCPVSAVVGGQADIVVKQGFVWSESHARRLKDQGKQGVQGGLVRDSVWGEATERGQQVFQNIQHGILHCGQLGLVLNVYPILHDIGHSLGLVPANAAHFALRVFVMRRMRDITAKETLRRNRSSRWVASSTELHNFVQISVCVNPSPYSLQLCPGC